MKQKKPKVEITVPVYNEEAELEKNIIKLFNFCNAHLVSYDWQITIADNASTDKTAAIASKIAQENDAIKLFQLKKKGRGRAVKKVWSQSHADYCVYMDLDLSTDLIHLPKILKALENDYDIAIGS